ncbi:EamA family transporter [Thorsellia kenyensis]|uniref:EamA family transporter n=1 Tax=Thorsellia kenyensis TaxID=1549888 RepID=A0ABV6C9Z0_9GAMM
MPVRDILIAVLVTCIWGTNFVVIHYGLQYFPPFLFAALRFILTFLPWAFFFKKPDIPVKYLMLNGFFLGFGQFGILFFALQGYISPGIASLLMQSQIFFSLFLSFIIFKDVPNKYQLISITICIIGFILIAMSGIQNNVGNITIIGLGLCLIASFSWACSNIVARKVGKVKMMNFLIWGSLYSSIPLSFMSLFLDGIDAIIDSISKAPFYAWASILWQSIGNTLLGFSLWFWLMYKHGTTVVSPLSLLVPVFGMLSAFLILNERLHLYEGLAALLIMTGLSLNIYFSNKKFTS